MDTLLVIDTETGGLDPDRDSLLSLAAVVWREGQLVADTQIFVNEPEPRITPDSIAVHGIDPTWLQAHGHSPCQAVQEFERFVHAHFSRFDRGDVLLAGHNVAFDVAFLKRLYRLAGVHYPAFYSHRLLDTAALGLFFILSGHLPSGVAKSDELFGYFQIAFGRNRRHSALGDARATAELINAFLKMATDNGGVRHTSSPRCQ